MEYVSTRGKVEARGFIDTVLMGLADDGGLMVPFQIPTVSLKSLKNGEASASRSYSLRFSPTIRMMKFPMMT